MHDAREKAIRDRQWELNASRNEGLAQGLAEGVAQGLAEGLAEGVAQGLVEGEVKGEIKLIRTLQEILQLPVSSDAEFAGKTLVQLQQQTSELQELISKPEFSLK